MTAAEIEQTKLLANALNTMATSCFTVGIATPLAGYLYNISGLRSLLTFGALVVGVGIWFLAGVALHLAARQVLRRLDS
jgi:hypothetical protein